MSHTLLSSSQLRGLENKNTQDNNTLNLWRGTKDEFINGSTEPLTWYCYKATTENTTLNFKDARLFDDGYNGALITYAKGKFVAVYQVWTSTERTTRAAYSLDGVNWVETTLPFAGYFELLTGGDLGFVAFDTKSTKIAYSSDGITWVQSTIGTTVPATNWYSAICAGGKFVATRGSTVAISTDGINWTLNTVTNLQNYSLLGYGNGTYVLFPNSTQTAFYSTDAVTWNTTTLPAASDYARGGVAYCNNTFFVVTQLNCYISSDGITWTKGTKPPTSGMPTRFGGVAENKFIVFDYQDKTVAQTSDGLTWTTFTGTLPAYITDWTKAAWSQMAYGAGKFVFVSDKYSNVAYASFSDRIYVLDVTPTTSTDVYTFANTPSTENITAINGTTLTLSDGRTYTYSIDDNLSVKATIGTLQKNYLCFTDNKDLSINNIVIAHTLPSNGNFGQILGSDGGASFYWAKGIPPVNTHTDECLTTDGKSTLVWKALIPSQSGKSGKYLTTNGTTTSWADVSSLPTQTGNAGKYLTTDGTDAYWETVLPTQSGQNNKFLKTDGAATSWVAETFTAPITEKHSIANDTSVLELTNDLSEAAKVIVYYNGLRLAEKEDINDTIYDYEITESSGTYYLNFRNQILTGSIIIVDIIYNKIHEVRQPSQEIELAYPFTNHSSYLSNVTSGSYPFVIDSTKQALMSGSTSYNTNFGVSWGYIQFTTPNYPTTLHVEGYASSENNYDWGAVVLSYTTSAALNSHLPTDTNQQGYATALRTTTPVTTTATLTNNNPILIFKSSGANTTSSSVDITLDPSTTYYLHLIYKKDTSGDQNDDRFYITNVRFTVPA